MLCVWVHVFGTADAVTWEVVLHLGRRHTLCRSSLTCGEPLGAPLTQCGPAALGVQTTGRAAAGSRQAAGTRVIVDNRPDVQVPAGLPVT
jgi:hypothetical protein